MHRFVIVLAASLVIGSAVPEAAHAERVTAVDPAFAGVLVAAAGFSPESSAIVSAQSDPSYVRVTDGTSGRVVVAQIVLPPDGDVSQLTADAIRPAYDGVPPSRLPACWQIGLLPSIGRDFDLCAERKRPTQLQTERGMRSKPATLVLSHSQKVVRLKWKKWGAKKSAAHGVLDFRVQGRHFRVPVIVTASRRTSCGTKPFQAKMYRRVSFKMTRASDRARFEQRRAVVRSFKCP